MNRLTKRKVFYDKYTNKFRKSKYIYVFHVCLYNWYINLLIFFLIVQCNFTDTHHARHIEINKNWIYILLKSRWLSRKHAEGKQIKLTAVSLMRRKWKMKALFDTFLQRWLWVRFLNFQFFCNYENIWNCSTPINSIVLLWIASILWLVIGSPVITFSKMVPDC